MEAHFIAVRRCWPPRLPRWAPVTARRISSSKPPPPSMAEQIGHAAENFRRDLAIEWLGTRDAQLGAALPDHRPGRPTTWAPAARRASSSSTAKCSAGG